ncbi:regulatory protein ArsR [Mycobacterium lentiflavum]|uniref:Metalloregulator ArsR/SmtB family transcription factor n=2 Tax=Mycobacterium simiae complex TaxID=2249310 RepID=A0A0E4CRJ9_MYCLN|nr:MULTISPECIES: metalloregulator ArsR/SmtB family transcription factor [Mycobacterium simiae complex]MEE3062421.1 metalloregulator ArsR/SmtB family transcription factor [Actinomycetota bacterium]ORJ52734.1 transcriptional regulator [Mycobacterium simiae]ULP45500.1 metalloregulator ArsR/SmtB family transcription factor [Mycobacterium lentiflavum]CQD24811.1 regulatory protein ArsR [Mycobacterium lentiflavum]
MGQSPLDTCDLLCLDLRHAESIRASLPSLDRIEVFAARARALSDPTRLTIAAALLTGDELCVCDVAWVVGQAQNLVSHHLRQLKVAKLVSSRRSGRLVMYRLTEQGRELTSAVMTFSVSPVKERNDV